MNRSISCFITLLLSLSSVFIPVMEAGSKRVKDGFGSEALANAIDAFDRGENIAAIAFLDDEISRHPENGLAYLIRADIKYRQGLLQEAFEDVNNSFLLIRLLRDPQTEAYAWWLRGTILMEAGETTYNEGIKSLKKAVKKDPGDADYLSSLFLAQLAAGKLKDSDETLNRMEKKFPDAVQLLICKGKKALIESDFKKARDFYEKALEKDPDSDNALLGRGVSRMELGDISDALEDLFRSAGQANESALRYIYGLDKKYLPDLERYVGSKELTDQSHWIYPDVLGSVYLENNYYEKAIEQFNKVNILDPTGGTYESLYICYYMLGDTENASESLDMLLTLDPDIPAYFQRKGGVAALKGDFKDAAYWIGRSLEKDPGNPFGYYRRGKYKAVGGDSAGALEDFDKALGIMNENARFLYERGLTYLSLGRGEDAGTDFRKIVSLYDEGQDNYRAAAAMARLGMSERALDVIRRAMTENPDDPEVYYYAAAVNSILGNQEEAVANLFLCFNKSRYDVPKVLYERDFEPLRHNASFRRLLKSQMPRLPEFDDQQN